MSFPNIPDINPHITLTRKEVINLLLSSIAMEELGISHILNAEAEKIQKIVEKKCLSVEEAIITQESLGKTLRNIIKTQMLLQFKLEDVLKIPLIDCECEDEECEDEDCECEDCECEDEDCECEDEDYEDEEEIFIKKERVSKQKAEMEHRTTKNINGREKRRRR